MGQLVSTLSDKIDIVYVCDSYYSIFLLGENLLLESN